MKVGDGVLIDGLGILMVFAVEGNIAELVNSKGLTFMYDTNLTVANRLLMASPATFALQVLEAIKNRTEFAAAAKQAIVNNNLWHNLFSIAASRTARTYPYNRAVYVKMQAIVNAVSTTEANGLLEMLKQELLNNGN